MIEAMAYLRDPGAGPTKRERLSRDDLAALAALMADKEWTKIFADHNQGQAAGDDDRLRRAHTKLAASAARITASAPRHRDRHINHSVEQLYKLSRLWPAPGSNAATPFLSTGANCNENLIEP